jgi:hypothetical protein
VAAHTIKAQETRAYLLNAIAKNMEPIVSAQLEAAKGMYLEETINGERVRVYRKAPDLKTGEYLLNQSAGKPVESINVNAEITSKVISVDE